MENSSSPTIYTLSDSYEGESSYVSAIMSQDQAIATTNNNRQQDQQRAMSADNNIEGPSLYYPSSPQQDQQQSGHEIPSSSSHHHAIVTIPEGSTISSTSSSIVSSTDKRPSPTATLTPSTIENIPSTLSSTENNNSFTPIIMAGDISSASSSSHELYYNHRQHHKNKNTTSTTTTTYTMNDNVEHDDSVVTTTSSSRQHVHQQRSGSGSVSSSTGRYNPSNYPIALKILVSNNIAGSIIGRAGQTISDFQIQSNARIELSQSGEYFPNTQDRVCLIQGDIITIKIAIGLLLERIYIIHEHQYTTQITWQQQQQLAQQQTRQTMKDHNNYHYYSQHNNNQNQQHNIRSLSSSLSAVGGIIEQSIVSNNTNSTLLFDFIVRLLVPATSCGKLIGKSGSNIKLMEEATGVYSIRLSPKENHHYNNTDQQQQHNNNNNGTALTTTNNNNNNNNMNNIMISLERIVTITGPSLQCCIQCVNMIIDGMILNPETSRYTNMTTCYSQYQHNISNNPLMTHQHQQMPPMTFTAAGGAMMIRQQQLQLQQQLLVPMSVQTNPSSPRRHYYEGGGVVVPAVGTRTSSNNHNPGLTRRIASSPNLPVQMKQQLHNNQYHHIHGSDGALRYASTDEQQPGTPSSSSDVARMNTTNVESSYAGNTNFRHISSSSLHQQNISSTSPLRTINNSMGSVYFVPQEQQHHNHQNHQGDAAGVVDTTTSVFHHDDMSSSSSLLRQNPVLHPQEDDLLVAQHSVSAPNLLDMHIDHSTSLQISNSNSSPSRNSITSGTSLQPGGGGMMNSIDYHRQSSTPTLTNLVPQTPTMIGPGCFTAQLLIPDSMIGSILGRGGRTLNELQMISGTRIRISQRGDYVPNTPRDLRIVTIRGPTSQAVWQAQYVISQRIVLPSTAISTSAATTSTAVPYIHTSNSSGNSRRGGGGAAGVNSGRNEMSYRPIGQQQHNNNEQQQHQSTSHTPDRIDKVKDMRTVIPTASVTTTPTTLSSKTHEQQGGNK